MLIKRKQIIDKKAIQRCRDKEYCELCGKWGTDVHHIIPKGRGFRLDVDENLMLLCHLCHMRVHSGEIPLKSEWTFYTLWEHYSVD